MMFMPKFCCALISVICLMLVVPAVETIVLPLRSASLWMLADFFATQRFAVTKCVMVNDTSFCRARLLVVEPHSRPMGPLAMGGIRFAEVTSWYLVSSFGILSSAFTASTIRWQRSIA